MARKGYDLLDKKRHVLIVEIAAIRAQAGEVWDRLCAALHTAYAALHVTYTEMGCERVLDIGRDMPTGAAASIIFRGIMGVELPCVKPRDFENDTATLPYSLSETTVSLDKAVLAWKKALELIVSWGAIENTIYKLDLHIKKTQKRANALRNITIPMYETRIKYMQERLEERERDELARLKHVKGRRT